MEMFLIGYRRTGDSAGNGISPRVLTFGVVCDVSSHFSADLLSVPSEKFISRYFTKVVYVNWSNPMIPYRLEVPYAGI